MDGGKVSHPILGKKKTGNKAGTSGRKPTKQEGRGKRALLWGRITGKFYDMEPGKNKGQVVVGREAGGVKPFNLAGGKGGGEKTGNKIKGIFFWAWGGNRETGGSWKSRGRRRELEEDRSEESRRVEFFSRGRGERATLHEIEEFCSEKRGSRKKRELGGGYLSEMGGARDEAEMLLFQKSSVAKGSVSRPGKWVKCPKYRYSNGKVGKKEGQGGGGVSKEGS